MIAWDGYGTESFLINMKNTFLLRYSLSPAYAVSKGDYEKPLEQKHMMCKQMYMLTFKLIGYSQTHCTEILYLI